VTFGMFAMRGARARDRPWRAPPLRVTGCETDDRLAALADPPAEEPGQGNLASRVVFAAADSPRARRMALTARQLHSKAQAGGRRLWLRGAAAGRGCARPEGAGAQGASDRFAARKLDSACPALSAPRMTGRRATSMAGMHAVRRCRPPPRGCRSAMGELPAETSAGLPPTSRRIRHGCVSGQLSM